MAPALAALQSSHKAVDLSSRGFSCQGGSLGGIKLSLWLLQNLVPTVGTGCLARGVTRVTGAICDRQCVLELWVNLIYTERGAAFPSAHSTVMKSGVDSF